MVGILSFFIFAALSICCTISCRKENDAAFALYLSITIIILLSLGYLIGKLSSNINSSYSSKEYHIETKYDIERIQVGDSIVTETVDSTYYVIKNE